MANKRVLVKRRKAIRNIRKITKTMELIATSRFKKAMDRASEAESFTRKVAELAADLSANAAGITHPLLQKREKIQRSVLLILTSNRGLCGGYNASILREAGLAVRRNETEGVEVQLELSGKRAIAFFRYQGIPVAHQYTHFEDKPAFEQVDLLANRYIQEYIAGKIDRVEVAYMKFINAGRQRPVVETLLPLDQLAPIEGVEKGAGNDQVDYEFLPSAGSILEEVLPISFKIRLFKCFLDAAVSEQIARRVAMKAATESAGDMIKSLSQDYNRLRQAQITTEIAEIIGGVEALK